MFYKVWIEISLETPVSTSWAGPASSMLKSLISCFRQEDMLVCLKAHLLCSAVCHNLDIPKYSLNLKKKLSMPIYCQNMILMLWFNLLLKASQRLCCQYQRYVLYAQYIMCCVYRNVHVRFTLQKFVHLNCKMEMTHCRQFFGHFFDLGLLYFTVTKPNILSCYLLLIEHVHNCQHEIRKYSTQYYDVH